MKVILWLIVFVCLPKIYGQELSKNTLFAGLSYGSSINQRADGMWLRVSLGVQRNIWDDKVRLVPSIGFGTYTHKGITDVGNAYYNTTNLKLNLNFDVVKHKAFSLFVGSGGY